MNLNNLNKNPLSGRSEDLTKVFDKRYKVNNNVNVQVQQKKKDFNFKMFGIRDKEDVRRELREANSVDGRVNRLKERMNSMNNNKTGGFR